MVRSWSHGGDGTPTITAVLNRFLEALRRLSPGADRRGAGPGRLPDRRPAANRPPRPGEGVPPPLSSRSHAHAYAGRVRLQYAPEPNGRPDPGEVVWTWVPYEDQPEVGKDRPVVVLGDALDSRAPDGELAVVLLSSKEHDGDQDWLTLGAGPWDREGRPSSVRLDRVLAVAPDDVRREGATLDRERFERVAAAVRRRNGWA